MVEEEGEDCRCYLIQIHLLYIEVLVSNTASHTSMVCNFFLVKGVLPVSGVEVVCRKRKRGEEED